MRPIILAVLLLCLAGCSHQPEPCRCTQPAGRDVNVNIKVGKGVDVSVRKGCHCWRDCTCEPGKCQCKQGDRCSTSCDCRGK